MNTYTVNITGELLLRILAVSLSLTLSLSAQAPAGTVREFKDLLKHIPSKDFLKLRGNTKTETAAAMSKDITARELNKETTFRIEVGKVDSWPFAGENITGWRVHCQDERVKEGSLYITVSAWAYIRADPDGVLKNIRPGKKIVVTGTITRADMTAVAEPVLNIDLRVSSIKPAK